MAGWLLHARWAFDSLSLHLLSPGLWPVARCSCSGVRFLALRVLLGAGLLLRPSARFLLVGAAPCWAPTLSVGPPSADPCCSVVRLLLRSPGYFLSPPACGRCRVVAAWGSVFWPCGCCSVLGCRLVRRPTFCGWVLPCGRAAASSVGLLPLSPGLWPVASVVARGSVFFALRVLLDPGLLPRPSAHFLWVGAALWSGCCFLRWAASSLPRPVAACGWWRV